MSSNRSFQEKSYQQHSEHYNDYRSGGKKEAHAKKWFDKGTVDAWRHQRMYKVIDPVLKVEQKARWLTVGDGRYGLDASYILDKNCYALATDISDSLLKDAKDLGYISEYKKENAESLTFQNSEFDFVLCKESYHHFPRPMIALYEMLRVASKGVVLIEPKDAYINSNILEILFRNFKVFVKLLLGTKTNRHSFEDSGNYLFSISRREVEKTAVGLNYKILAFKGLNDAYIEGVENESLTEKGPLQKKVRFLINIKNILCKLGFMDYGLLIAIIFKKKPDDTLLQELSKEGYDIITLPENPYISA